MKRTFKVIAAFALVTISVIALGSRASAQVPDFEASAEATAGCPTQNTTVELTVTNNSATDVWVYVYLDPATDYEAVRELPAGNSEVINTGANMAPAGTFVVEFSETAQGTPLETLRVDWDCEDGENPPDTNTLPLHNNTAAEGDDCPDEASDYWHFVLTPNNGSSAFVSITLNLGDDTVTVSGDDIIPNGVQEDNVFVAVPDGYEVDDLVLAGSSAEVTGPATKFVLSHVCTGGTTPTTTPTTVTPTTQPEVSPTTLVATPTTRRTQVLGEVVTDNPRSLPITGSSTLPLTLAGLGLVVLGYAIRKSGRLKHLQR